MHSSAWALTGSGGNTTPGTTVIGGGNPHLIDPDWLCAPQKPQMITDYQAELQVQTQLQTLAAGYSPAVVITPYNNAVTALALFLNALTNVPTGNPVWTDATQDTYLGAAGGATLRAKWGTVASTRAVLHVSIGQAQATKASNDAIASSAASAPATVTGLPTLPNATYPANRMVWDTTTKRLYRSTGSTWENPTTQASQIMDKLTLGQLDVNSVASESIVSLAITTQKLAATSVQTYNFAQDTDDVNGGIYASAGAALVVNTSATPAIICDSGGLKIGKRVFSDYWFRLLNGIDGSSSAGMVLWRGNNDQTINGGAPVIADSDGHPASNPRLIINTTKIAVPGDRNSSTSIHFQVQPLTNADNLDALSHIEMIYWQRNGAGSMYSEGTYAYPPVSSRRYKIIGTPSDTANAGHGQLLYDAYNVTASSAPVGCTMANGASYPMALILQCRICNVYGDSAQHYFIPPSGAGIGSTTSTGRWTDVGTAAPYSGGTTGGGGSGNGSIGGGGCPAPWVPILLASGLSIAAGSLVDGMRVAGVIESTMEPTVGIVREPHMRWVDRVRVVLEDGRTPEFTDTHRVAMASGGWKEVRNLLPGELLVAQRPSRVLRVEPAGKGQVISFVVEGCHTYFSDDILSHNTKPRTL